MECRCTRIKSSSHNGHANFVAQLLIDVGTENDVSVWMNNLLHQTRSVVDFKQSEVTATSD